MRTWIVPLSGVLAALWLAGCGGAVPGSASEALQEGWTAYSTGDYEIALNRFARADADEAASERERFSARLGLATVYHRRSNPDLGAAREQYSRMARVPLEEARRLSLLGLGQVEAEQGNVEAAREHFRVLQEEFAGSLESHEAVLQEANTYLNPVPAARQPGGFTIPPDQDVETALALLEHWLERYPDNALAATMQMVLGDRYVEMGRWEKAIEHLQLALEKGITSARTRSALKWRIARIAEMELQDYALAEQYYEAFINEMERHVLYYRATQSLDRVRELRAQAGGEAAGG